MWQAATRVVEDFPVSIGFIHFHIDLRQGSLVLKQPQRSLSTVVNGYDQLFVVLRGLSATRLIWCALTSVFRTLPRSMTDDNAFAQCSRKMT
jgi:hypothetical protein